MNYNRLHVLKTKFPSVALELDLVSGRIDPNTGLINRDFKSDEMQDLIEYYVLEVLDLINEQGHSNFSHGYLTTLLIPLLSGKPITPLTGKDWEWDKQQNKRCCKVFRNENGTAYFIDGRAFSDNGGKTYWTSRESFKDITFPCSKEDLETEYVIIDTSRK